MERFTTIFEDKYDVNIIGIGNKHPNSTYNIMIHDFLIPKLAEYENTGLEPSEVEQLIMENERLKSDLQYAYLEENNKVAIEKLEEVLKFIYGNKWTNIELCVDNSPLKIIRNKLDTMISGLKGDK